MGLLEKKKGTRPAAVALGYGCALGVLSVSSSDLFSVYTGFSHLASPLIYGVILALLLTGCAAQRFTCSDGLLRLLRLLDVALIVSAGVWALASLAVLCDVGSDGMRTSLAALSELARRLMTIVLCVLWDCHLSRMRDYELPKVVSLSTLLAATLFLCSTVIGPGIFALLIGTAAASIVLLKMLNDADGGEGVPLATSAPSDGEPRQPQGSLYAKFLASRVAWHLGLVFMVIFSYKDAQLAASSKLAVALLALVLVAVMGLVASIQIDKRTGMMTAILVPLIVVGIPVVAFLAPSGTGVSRVMPVVATLVWYMLIAIQLPTYRQLTHMEPLRFALLERAVPLVAVYAVYLVLSIVRYSQNTPSDGLGMFLSVTFTAAMVLFSVITMVRHIWRYYPQLEPNLQHEGYEETLTSATDCLAASHGLTPRETDVLGYLLRGYSKKYAAKALCVSEATVKTHAVSIYRKLDINSHDELVDAARDAVR